MKRDRYRPHAHQKVFSTNNDMQKQYKTFWHRQYAAYASILKDCSHVPRDATQLRAGIGCCGTLHLTAIRGAKPA